MVFSVFICHVLSGLKLQMEIRFLLYVCDIYEVIINSQGYCDVFPSIINHNGAVTQNIDKILNTVGNSCFDSVCVFTFKDFTTSC